MHTSLPALAGADAQGVSMREGSILHPGAPGSPPSLSRAVMRMGFSSKERGKPRTDLMWMEKQWKLMLLVLDTCLLTCLSTCLS